MGEKHVFSVRFCAKIGKKHVRFAHVGEKIDKNHLCFARFRLKIARKHLFFGHVGEKQMFSGRFSGNITEIIQQVNFQSPAELLTDCD